MNTLVVIPARLRSTRLPSKPVRRVDGYPLIVVQVKQVLALGLDAEVVVATDSRLVKEAVAGLVPCYSTSPTCQNGTERVAEVVLDHQEFRDVDVVVDVQADQLFLPRDVIPGAIDCVVRKGVDIGTAVAPLFPNSMTDPNRVKALVAPKSRCAAFFRLMTADLTLWPLWSLTAVADHIGVYAYTPETLRRWVELPPTILEKELSLEQSRPLEAGMVIGAAWVETHPIVIDTEDDLKRVVWAFGKDFSCEVGREV